MAVQNGPVEEPWELPKGWRWARLQDVAEVNPATTLDREGDDPITFVGMAAVSEESGYVDVSTVRPAAQVAKGFTRFRGGDVLFAKITPCMENGKIAVVPKLAFGVGAGSTEFHVVRSDDMLARFLFHFLVQQRVRQDARRNMSGSAGQLRISTDYLRLLPIPVPPRDAQQRVVDRIDELFAEIDDGERALEEARELSVTYRRTLLHSAVGGWLSSQWREQNPGRGGADVMSGISQLADRATSGGRGRSRRAGGTEPPEELSALPGGWNWVPLGDLISGIEAGLNVKAEGRPPKEGEVGIIKVSSVTWDDFDEDQSKTLPRSARFKERDLVKPGDFLISRANTLELVGAPAIVRQLSRTLVLSDKVLRLLIAPEVKEWVYFVLKSPHGRRQIEARSTGNQLSMRNIPQEGIRSLPIPIPPARELDYLNRLLRTNWDTSQRLLADLADTISSGSLRQSILAAAFRGDLVT